jgi:hypothetical protein
MQAMCRLLWKRAPCPAPSNRAPMYVRSILVRVPKPATLAAALCHLIVATRRIPSTLAPPSRHCPRRTPPVEVTVCAWRLQQDQHAHRRIVSARTMALIVVPHSSTRATYRRTRYTSARTGSFQHWSKTVELVPAPPMLSRELLLSERLPMTCVSINVLARMPMFP